MAILNWRDHPVLRFNDFPPASANENAVYIASDIGMAAFIAKGGNWQLLSVLDAVAQTYTWATKPPAVGNEGLEIIVSDLQNSRWSARAGAWRPANGSCTLTLDLTGVQTQQGTGDIVPGVTPIKIPARDFLSTPGANLTFTLPFKRVNAAATRTFVVEAALANAGVTIDTVSRANGTSANSGGIMRGTVGYSTGTAYRSMMVNEPHGGSWSYTESPLSTIPAGLVDLTIRAATGDASNAEIMSFGPLLAEICM